MKSQLKKIIIAMMLTIALPSFAADLVSDDGIYYNFLSHSDLTVEVTSGANEYTGSIVIPETIMFGPYGPYSVISIGTSAFSGSPGLTSVTIPNSVTSIGSYAFKDCIGLQELIIADGTEVLSLLGSSLFVDCPLEKLYLGRNISYSTSYGFDTAPFYNITTLKEVTIGDSVTSIGDYAFYNCSGLTSITIPNSVSSIGTEVFRDCSGLKSVAIGNSVTSIGYNAFSYCSGLTEVNISDLKSWCNIDFRTINSNPLYYAQHLKLNGEAVTDLIISDGITEIKKYAFCDCLGLNTVSILNSVTSIGERAFENCFDLTSVSIGNSVSTIGEYAFKYCGQIKSLTIGNSVTSIDYGAFFGCSNIKYVEFNAKNLNQVGGSNNLGRATNIVVGEDVVSIPSAIINSSYATSIVSHNTIPPVCYSDAFSSVNKSKCTLYVPSASYMDYWSADVWKEFANIKTFTITTAISFSAENFTIKNGESIQLEPIFTPSDNHVTDLIWTSSNPEVATVSSAGKVVGIKPGEAIITAETMDGSNLAASCIITVETTLAESIKLSQTEVELAPYESIVLTYTILPEYTTNKSVTWSSSDESIASFKVNNDGSTTVLILKDDKAVITVTTNDGSNLSASCVVGKTSGVDITTENEVTVTVEGGEIVVKNVTGIVTVYNLTGIAVATETADGNEVRFDNLTPGVYIVVVNNKSVKVFL